MEERTKCRILVVPFLITINEPRNNAKQKRIKGTIENVYENIIKIKLEDQTGVPYYEWVGDDSSDVMIIEENLTQEIHVPQEGTPPTQDNNSSGDISYNPSPRSNRSFDDRKTMGV